MKKGLFLLGLMSCATIVTAVTYLYRTDNEVHTKVDEASRSVVDLCSMVGEKIRSRADVKQQSYENEVARNQDWADQQWEALGI